MKKYLKDVDIFSLCYYYNNIKEFEFILNILTTTYDQYSAPYRDYTIRGILSLYYYKKELWLSIFFINFNWYFGKKFNEINKR